MASLSNRLIRKKKKNLNHNFKISTIFFNFFKVIFYLQSTASLNPTNCFFSRLHYSSLGNTNGHEKQYLFEKLSMCNVSEKNIKILDQNNSFYIFAKNKTLNFKAS